MPLLAALLSALTLTVASAQQAPFRQPAAKAPAKHAAPATGATRTRFIIGLERAADFKVSALASPNRVLVDLPQMRLGLPSPPGDTPVGVVTNVEDPEKLGRIIAQVPEILHEEPSPWALPVTPFAGSGHGLVLIPEVGAADS